MFTVIDPGIDGLLPIGGEMSREDCAEAVHSGMLHAGGKLQDESGTIWHAGELSGMRGLISEHDLDEAFPWVTFYRATSRRFIEERL